MRPMLGALTPADQGVMSGASGFRGVPGHQFVGVVADLSPMRPEQQRWLGKRVVATPEIPCAACDFCRQGLSRHCPSREVLGLSRRDGCLAEAFRVPLSCLTEVPGALATPDALFALPASRALAIAGAARFEGKPFVTVLGDSVEALITAQVLARRNASVRVLGYQPRRFAMCERWGVRHRHVAEAGRRHDQDIVVEMIGDGASLSLAMQMARPRATVFLASPQPGGLSDGANEPRDFPDLAPAVRAELTLIGIRAGSPAEGLAALARREIDTTGLVQRRFRLEQWQEALLAARVSDALQVVFEF